MDFSVKNDIAQVLAKFPWVKPENYTKLVSNVLNSTAYHVGKNLQAQMDKDFDRPTPFAKRAPYAWRSKPDNLEAGVRIRDFAVKGSPAIKYLGPQIYGGTRSLKGSEKALRAAGLLPNDLFIVPAQGAPLDQYGNLRPSYVNTILSYLRANRDSTQNRAVQGKAKRMQFFAVSEAGRLPLGIYERKGGTIRMVIAFVKEPNYKKRYKFFETAQDFTRTYFMDKLRREAEYMTRTQGARFEREILNSVGDLFNNG